jgi:uncharacterized protein (TIRG00374 family)
MTSAAPSQSLFGRILIAVLKVVFSGVLLVLFLRRTDLSRIRALLSELPPDLILTLCLLNIGAVFISAWKWRMLLPSASYGRLAVACFASYYVGLLLPGQLAQEGAKAYYLARGRSFGVAKVAASVLVDKIAGTVGLLLVACLGLALSQGHLPTSLKGVFAAVTVAALVGLFSLRIAGVYAWLRRATDYVARLFPTHQRIAGGLRGVFEAWHLYSRNMPLLIANIVLSAIYQLIGVLMFSLLARELNVSIGFFDWSWIVGALTVALFLPITIGGLGIREGTLIGILTTYGYSKETAVAISLTAFSFVIMLAVIGLILSLSVRVSAKP